MVHKTFALSVLVLLILGLTLSAAAQSDPQVIVNGLNAPRGLFYADDGTLYIAEGGAGGTVEIETPEGPGTFGSTSQVSILTPDGAHTPLITNLPSAGDIGASGLYVTDESIWLVEGAGPPNTVLTFALLELDRRTLRVKHYVDLFTHEAVENPDGNEIDSNPTDVVVAEDGTVYIADAGCNCVLTWTAADGLQTFLVWPENPVPTAVAFGPEGDLYVGFLSPGPFTPGSARIERWTTEGGLVETFDGLTMVVDVLVDDMGTIYAVELAGGFGENGPLPGRVITVSAEGVTPVMEGLHAPWGLAQNADGHMVVSVGTSFGLPGSGMVIAVESM